MAASEARRRVLAFALVAAAVGSGIAWFLIGGAPTGFTAVNGAGLVLVAVALVPPVTGKLSQTATPVLLGGAAFLVATLVFGPDVEGVRRWLPIGPVQLHVGMIVLPAMFVALAAARAGTMLVATTVLAVIFWLQPDAGSASALVGGTAGLALARRGSQAPWLGLGIAIAGLAATLARPDPLEPVAFVETALGDAWRTAPLLGAMMALSLAAAILLAPWLVEHQSARHSRVSWAVSGAFAGFAASSFILDHPQPLVGYGASPILGMALALWLVRSRADSTA